MEGKETPPEAEMLGKECATGSTVQEEPMWKRLSSPINPAGKGTKGVKGLKGKRGSPACSKYPNYGSRKSSSASASTTPRTPSLDTPIYHVSKGVGQNQIVMGSGTAESVAPSSLAPWIPIVPSVGSVKASVTGQLEVNASPTSTIS